MSVFQLRYLPNAICIARIALTFPIVFYLVSGEYRIALVLIVIAGLSDGLDGYIAKRFNWRSRVGGLLDPTADKLMFVSVFAALTHNGLVPVWLFAVVIGRDIVIVAGALAYEFLIGPVEPRPTRVGKLNTVIALLFLFFVMTYQIYAWPPELTVLLTGSMVFVVSLVSGLHYVLTWSRLALKGRAA